MVFQQHKIKHRRIEMNNKKKESITLELTKEEYSKLNEYCKIKNVDYSKVGSWKKYMKNI